MDAELPASRGCVPQARGSQWTHARVRNPQGAKGGMFLALVLGEEALRCGGLSRDRLE